MNFSDVVWRSDPQYLKQNVSVAAALIAADVDVEEIGGELAALCPFHADTNPSLRIWRGDDGVERFKCFPCGESGDVIDLVRGVYDIGFVDAMSWLAALLEEGLPDAPEPAERGEPGQAVGDWVRASERANLALLGEFLLDKGIGIPPAWLAEQFGVLTRGDEIVIPHRTAGGEIVAAKHRCPPDWMNLSVSGSRLTALYGEWRDKGRKEVVLCEGESDTWTVAWWMRDEQVDVLGLPSGAGARARDDWLERLRDRNVTFLFDADLAGRLATARWLVELGYDAHVAALPDGHDSVSAGEKAVRRALDEAWTFTDPGYLPVQQDHGRYIRLNKDDNPPTPLSNFVMDLRQIVVRDDGGVVFDVDVPGHQQTQQITGRELANPQRMRDWCADRVLSWKGSSRDLSDLLELLRAQSVTVPRVRGTSVIGYHEDSFVLPDCVIGSGAWAFVPPDNDVGIEKALDLCEPGSWDSDLPTNLAALHRSDVITPVLGWVAAAPLRAMLEQFPVLALVGGSGWGKTTLIRAVLDAFGFWTMQPVTLTATTPHGVHSYAGATNAFPVWFDEYRHGARYDAKLALDQVLRDAWDGSAAVKGGMSDNRMKIRRLPARAPIVVTGEDAFTETSHAERMVLIPIPAKGRNATALSAVESSDRSGFGRAYLEWLLGAIRSETLPAPPDRKDRMEQSRAVAAWGWDLLTMFSREVCGVELGRFNASRVAAQHEEVNRHPVIIEAILETLDKQWKDGFPICWADDGDVYVRLQELVKKVKDDTDIVLPGGTKAVESWLRERFTTDKPRGPFGRALRLQEAASEIVDDE